MKKRELAGGAALHPAQRDDIATGLAGATELAPALRPGCVNQEVDLVDTATLGLVLHERCVRPTE